MPLNLPPSLPLRSSTPPASSGSNRPLTSISNKWSASNKPTTSVGRNRSNPYTSIDKATKKTLRGSVYGEAMKEVDDEEMADKRYAYSRQLIMERKKKEREVKETELIKAKSEIKKEEVKKVKANPYAFNVAKGSMHKSTGRGSLAWQVARARLRGRFGSFNTIDKKNEKYIVDYIDDKAEKKPVDGKFTSLNKTRMKNNIASYRRGHKGVFSESDEGVFKKIIDNVN